MKPLEVLRVDRLVTQCKPWRGQENYKRINFGRAQREGEN